uniref:Uncharacterized protein n=1 Tax=Tanacetum cinerariifolium TaxID=118510 RepID=A0A699H6K1_TANCI|nr:hypothetical protein [Tanacetum cinerariifolium]
MTNSAIFSAVASLFFWQWELSSLAVRTSPGSGNSITGNSKLHSSQDDHPITKLLSTTKGEYKFGMEVPDAMISDAIKKKAWYKYYMAKKVETNVPNKLKKDVVPRKIRSLTIVEEAIVGELAKSISIQESCSQRRRRSQLTIDNQTGKAVADMYNEWGQKLKGPVVEDPAVQSLLDLRKGSKASRLESLRQKKQPLVGEGSSTAQNKYYSLSDTASDETLYSLNGDDDERYGVFMHNKSTTTPNSTYFSLTVTSSSLYFIQALLDETTANELKDFISHPLYTDAHTTSVVHNPKGNPELTRYISCASEVPLGTHVDLLATKTLTHEMFPDKNAHHIPSLPAKKIPYRITTLQPSLLQAKAKKLMQKAKKNTRKFNCKKAVVQKFKEHDQKLEALTNFNVSEAFEKAVQAKVLTKIKKLLPTHIPIFIANYVKPRLNTSMLEKSGLAKRSTTWFDLFLKSDIDLDKNCILGPSIVAIAKNFKELIQKDELLIAYLEGARLEGLKWNSDEGDVSKPRSSKRHMSKSTKPHPCFYNNDYTYLVHHNIEEKYTTSITKHYDARYYKEGIEDRIPIRWSKEVLRYHFKALNGIHHWEENIIDFFKAGMSDVTKGNVFSDLRIKSVVHIDVKNKRVYGFLTLIVVRRSNDKEHEFSYADLPRLSVNDVEDMYLLRV